MTRLETVRISRASAEQRAGRAGRLGPGVCYRLWSEGTHGALLPFTPPEIRSADLAPLALELARWGVSDAQQLAWLDPPPAGHLAGARSLLELLGALDDGGRLTVSRRDDGAASPPIRASPGSWSPPRRRGPPASAPTSSPFSPSATSPAASGRTGRATATCSTGWSCCVAAARRARRGRRATGGRSWPSQGGNRPPMPRASGGCWRWPFPTASAGSASPAAARYLFSGGFGGKLSPRSAVKGGEWLVAVEVAGRPGGEGEIRLANVLSRETVEGLFGSRPFLASARSTGTTGPGGWWPARCAASASFPCRSGRRRQDPRIRSRRCWRYCVAGGLELLDWSPAARQLQARAMLVARRRSDWPDLADAALLASLEEWLAPYLAGVTRLDALRKVDLVAALQSRLGWQRQQELARLAPERLEVPSGSNIRLDYEAEDGPVLACKLQELFGFAETPTVVDGTVPVLIHLLSPAGRPLAVTRDLRSFWNDVYPEVRKEMKGRYPKHPWPDDPWNAEPTRRTKKGRG